jgi:hypothetical protein
MNLIWFGKIVRGVKKTLAKRCECWDWWVFLTPFLHFIISLLLRPSDICLSL